MTRPTALLVVLLLALVLRLFETVGLAPLQRIAPLSLAEPIGRVTPARIAALRDVPQDCQSLLREAGAKFTVAPELSEGEYCGYRNALALRDGATAYRPGVTASCPVAVGLFLWDKQVLQPAAQEAFGQRVTMVETMGTYSCRRVGGSATGRVSEHASANAIDIGAVKLADGRRIALEADWNGDAKDAAFLRRLRDGACNAFTTVLSPDHDEAHYNHLHFDQAVRRNWSYCR